MTKEELLKLTAEQLAERVLGLDRQLSQEKENAKTWRERYTKSEAKFNRYKEAVKSIVLFID